MQLQPALSITERIADHLETEIIAGRMAPRARIQEVRLAQTLGVSRGSVREALLILERCHLIDIVPRRGAAVSPFGAAEIDHCSDLYQDLQIRYLSDLARSDRALPHELQLALEAMGSAARDGDANGVLAARRRFLRAGFPAVGNRFLVSGMASLLPSSLRLARLAFDHPRCELRDCVRYHQSLLGAMADGDLDRIAQLVRAFSRREQDLALCVVDEAA